MGAVSLLADATYEGARSSIGPYLGLLGASAGIVGLVSGLGEFLGYALRLASGVLADRTERYWLLTILGYALILAVPLLALAASWQLAALFVIVERLGKAVRTPARDAILSYATHRVGRGRGFALHEALDQAGAVLGPLMLAGIVAGGGGLRAGFSSLAVPAVLTLGVLWVARRIVPEPARLEAPLESDEATKRDLDAARLPRLFWPYALFTATSVAGFAAFPLIAYHLSTQSLLEAAQIPLAYALAMAVDAGTALVIGRVYDRVGLLALIVIPILTLPVPVLAFSFSGVTVVLGVALWGAVMGVHETVMRAAIADLTPMSVRGRAYGLFNVIYGGAWLAGSALMGLLYELSVGALIAFAVAMELASIPWFIQLQRITGVGRSA